MASIGLTAEELLKRSSVCEDFPYIFSNKFHPGILRTKIIKKITTIQIQFLCRMGLTHGNNIDRILTSIKSVPEIEMLSTAVSILNVENRARESRTITLSRIVACFPEISLEYLHKDGFKIQNVDAKLANIHTEYPKVARHQVCAAILPNSLTKFDLSACLNVIMVPHMIISEAINKNDRKWNLYSREQRAISASYYLKRSLSSTVLPQTTRNNLSIELGIITGQGGLTEEWKMAAKSATQYLVKQYNFDFNK